MTKIHKLQRALLLSLALLISSASFAAQPVKADVKQSWLYDASVAYGFGPEYQQNYDNSGWWLQAAFFNYKIDQTLRLHLSTSLGLWTAHTNVHKHNQTLSFGLDFRAYFAPPENKTIAPYLNCSFGPVYLFQRYLGTREQGANWAFQTFLGGGLELQVNPQHKIETFIGLIHYCNAGLAHPNEGFNIAYNFGLGYLF
jgi:hypothetical protein